MIEEVRLEIDLWNEGEKERERETKVSRKLIC